MKKIMLILGCICFSVVNLWSQTEETSLPILGQKFKPHYAGTSISTGVMFMPQVGSAFYVTPKLNFQVTPRFFLNAGVGVVQYSLLPSKMKYDLTPQRTATSAYIFAEGLYLLNERWSINGSVMKDVGSKSLQQMNPNCMPSEAMHFGVDYKVTPHITVGARIGYSNGGRSNLHSPFYPY